MTLYEQRRKDRTKEQVETQKRLLDLGIYFHNFAVKHDIPYSLVGGTMLGAVRDKQFIPWDDDMDFMFSYDNIDKLNKAIEEHDHPYYKFVSWENTPGSKMLYSKLVDTRYPVDNIASDSNNKYADYLSIDLFPVFKSKKKGYSWYFKLFIALKWARNVKLGPKRDFAKLILKIFPNKWINNRIKKSLNRQICNDCGYSTDLNFFARALGKPQTYKNLKLNNWDDLIDLEFEGFKFKNISNYDEYLNKCIGIGYITPPNEIPKNSVHSKPIKN